MSTQKEILEEKDCFLLNSDFESSTGEEDEVTDTFQNESVSSYNADRLNDSESSSVEDTSDPFNGMLLKMLMRHICFNLIERVPQFKHKRVVTCIDGWGCKINTHPNT